MSNTVRFAEIRRKLEQHGWSLERVAGSHHYFTGPGRPPLSIPVHGGRVKLNYDRQADKAILALRKQGPTA